MPFGVQARGALDLSKLQAQFKMVRSPAFRRSLLKQLSVEGLNQVATSFDKEQDPYGRNWKPWSHSYAAQRKGGKILSNTGRLRNSFRSANSDATFTISSKVVYAAIQNYGGRPGHRTRQATLGARAGRGLVARASGANVGRVGIPARPFLPAQGRLGARWSKAFAEIASLAMARAMRQRPTSSGGH